MGKGHLGVARGHLLLLGRGRHLVVRGGVRVKLGARLRARARARSMIRARMEREVLLELRLGLGWSARYS